MMNKRHRIFILLFSMAFLFLVLTEPAITAQTSQPGQAAFFLNSRQAEARKFDEYGRIAIKDENARLDNFVLEIKSDLTTKGYIIAYGGRNGRAQDALKMANRAKTYALKKGRLKASYFITIDGGYQEDPATELWIVPNGALAPSPSPSLDPSEIVPAKGSRKSKPTKPRNKIVTKR